MLNQVQIIGRLGQDPESKFLPSGSQVVNFSVATTEKWKDKDGQKKEETQWHRMVAYGKTAELIEKYLKKGSLAYFSGKLKTRSWDDKDKPGKKLYATEITVNEVKFLSSADNTERPQTSPTPSPAKATDYSADDIPF